MRKLPYILAVILLAGCSSHKQTSASAATDIETSMSRDIERVTQRSSDLWAMLTAVCDSLRLSMSADLIVLTPEGIAVVNPEAVVSANNLHADLSEQRHCVERDTVADSSTAAGSLHARETEDGESDTAAIARPASGSCIFFILLIPAAIILWLLKRIKT